MPKTIHGKSHSRIYQIWNSMKQRCSNPRAISYKNYGAKGVVVCDEWERNFETFYKWAMSNGYEEHLTIDRINSNGNYCPENCRWATPEEQQHNTSYNRVYSYKGVTRDVTQWAEVMGVSRNMLYKRLNRGWTIEKALTIKNKRTKEI